MGSSLERAGSANRHKSKSVVKEVLAFPKEQPPDVLHALCVRDHRLQGLSCLKLVFKLAKAKVPNTTRLLIGPVARSFDVVIRNNAL